MLSLQFSCYWGDWLKNTVRENLDYFEKKFFFNFKPQRTAL